MTDIFERIAGDRLQFSAPAVLFLPELGEVQYIVSDETTVTHHVDSNLEVLKDAAGERVVGVKITNLPALLGALLDCAETRRALRAMADARGVAL